MCLMRRNIVSRLHLISQFAMSAGGQTRPHHLWRIIRVARFRLISLPFS
jgi:hypothetical protein